MDNIKPFVNSFKRSYRKDFKKNIPDKEAYNSLFNLVGFIKTLDKIDKRIKTEKSLSKKYKKLLENDKIKLDTNLNNK